MSDRAGLSPGTQLVHTECQQVDTEAPIQGTDAMHTCKSGASRTLNGTLGILRGVFLGEQSSCCVAVLTFGAAHDLDLLGVVTSANVGGRARVSFGTRSHQTQILEGGTIQTMLIPSPWYLKRFAGWLLDRSLSSSQMLADAALDADSESPTSSFLSASSNASAGEGNGI